jgi:hypothetical protein
MTTFFDRTEALRTGGIVAQAALDRGESFSATVVFLSNCWLGGGAAALDVVLAFHRLFADQIALEADARPEVAA